MVKSIYLQDGEEIFVDDEDYEKVSQHTWTKIYKHNTRYISSYKSKNVNLQNFILEGSFQIEKNNDFTKSNLTTKGNKNRWCKAKYNSSSKYKGVSWDKKTKKWSVCINNEGKRKFLGRYFNEDRAGRVYNQAVLDYWNGDGYMNLIGEDNRTSKIDHTKKKQHISRGTYSGYRGVQKIGAKDCDKYRSFTSYNGKSNYIGIFRTKQHAALAYNKCVIHLHGDDAILNDVPMTDELKEFIDNWEIPEKIKQLKED